MICEPQTAISILLSSTPPDMQERIRAAHVKYPNDWFRAPTFRLWRMAMRRLLLSRGLETGDRAFILLVETALNLR